tara:strand:+ start:215 stop:475 length:261 start_codon:yes stop_codon:yes gene_type:complete
MDLLKKYDEDTKNIIIQLGLKHYNEYENGIGSEKINFIELEKNVFQIYGYRSKFYHKFYDNEQEYFILYYFENINEKIKKINLLEY